MMRPSIDSFDDLLGMARGEPQPCRLLTVLVRAETAYRRRANGAEALVDEGCLVPVMTRDWPIDKSLTLATIAETADQAESSWQFVMSAVMPGQYGQAPSAAACEPHLERMAKALMIGEGLDEFVFFNRAGEPVQIHKAATGT